MGLTGSRVVSKLANSFSFGGSPEDEANASRALATFKGTPFVYTRRG